MKTQFTPGPWSIETPERTGIGRLTVCMQDCERARFAPVCSIENGNSSALHLKIGAEEQQANAALIAAAPELFEALEEAYSQVKELCQTFNVPLPDASFVRYESALAKARGDK